MEPNAAPPAERILVPFREFAQASASGGIVLIAAAVTALVWANSPLADSYVDWWSTPIAIEVGPFRLSDSVRHWINDGLMAVFFLVVGLEIKREVLVGELVGRRAAFPVAAALGGALLPAVIFLVLVGSGPGSRGWGIPMATDIAFALGLLALLGSRAPSELRLFLTALAIVDDLLAVVIIAVFYTAELDLPALAAAAAILVALVGANRLEVRRPLVYALLGVGLWLAMYASGIHATIAGVLLAATIPARTRIDSDAFVEQALRHVRDFEGRTIDGEDATTEEHHAALWELEEATERAQAPMLRLEHALHPWVAFVIVPLFALANAGVRPDGDLLATIGEPIPIAIIIGLVVGKQVGIMAGAGLAVRLGAATLPKSVTWRQIYGAAWLGGVGFTMSLFVATLAYGEGSPELAVAKVGILVASFIAAIGGLAFLRFASSAPSPGTAGPLGDTARPTR